jgi:hypothetical protein
MAIKQFNALWAKKEDRIKLNITTSEDEVLKLWLTRFITKFIIQSYEKIMQTKLESTYDSQTATLIQEIKKEKAESTFTTGYKAAPPENMLLGPEAILVIGFDMNIKDEFMKMNFFLSDQKKIGIVLHSEQANSMVALIEKIAKTADWDIANEKTINTSTDTSSVISRTNKKLH